MQRATRRWRRINNSLRIRRVAQHRSTSPAHTRYLSTSPSTLLSLSLARSLSISRNKSSSLCLKCLLNPCRLHVPFSIIPLHMLLLLLLLLPCCVSFRFVSCQCVPSRCPAVILSTGQIFAQRCCRPCRWIAPAIAHFSPRLDCCALFIQQYIYSYIHRYMYIYIYIYCSYSACICLAMSCWRGSCCFL